MSQRPVIAIIGRPNVGKSTLFNRLIQRRQAIVSPIAGTTRDRHYTKAQLGHFMVDLIDTAGIDEHLGQAIFGHEMLEQVQLAVQEADLLIFVLDAQAGLIHEDQVLAEIIRKASTPTVVLVNKVDNPDQMIDPKLLALGLGPTVTASLAQHRGSQELIDCLIDQLDQLKLVEVRLENQLLHEDLPHIALVGRPNVGKSSLFNVLVDDERVIVSDIPGTTRDTIDSKVEVLDGQSFIVTDTAGLRRRGRIGSIDKIERYSHMRTLRAIDQADVVILVADATEGLTRGDVRAAAYATEQNKHLITVLNKSDLVDPRVVNISRFPFLSRQPMLFVSAKDKIAIDQLRELIQERLRNLDDELSQNYSKEIRSTKPDQ